MMKYKVNDTFTLKNLQKITLISRLNGNVVFKTGCCKYRTLPEDEFNQYIEANKAEEMVTITKKEYDELVEDSKFLMALEAAGVDNWEGYGVAGSWRLSSK